MKRAVLVVVVVLLAALCAGSVFAEDSRFIFSEKSVKDKRTDLVWAREANLGDRNWNGAFELVKELNQKTYAGFNDWRLPTKDEMVTLLKYAIGVGYGCQPISNRPNQPFNQMGFYDVNAAIYWTSSNVTENANKAWSVNFYDCGVKTGANKTESFYVWPVRSASEGSAIDTRQK
jgi:hypothetical protein